MSNLRDELFPNGKPTVEEFIAVVAKYVQEQWSGSDVKGADLPVEISAAEQGNTTARPLTKRHG